MLGWDDLLDGYLGEASSSGKSDQVFEKKYELFQEKKTVKVIHEIFQPQIVSESDSFFDEFYGSAATPNEPEIVQEAFSSPTTPTICACKICFQSTSDSRPENLVCCFGCGDVWHRSCLNTSKRLHCPLPFIYRFAHPAQHSLWTHAPWYCNACVCCSKCSKNGSKSVCCRKCGKSLCLSCYRQPAVTSFSFRDLSNFACDSCLQCVNCGGDRTTSGLYDDNRFCRPCYLSRQIGAICPLCQQIYHWLPLRSDFGDVPFVDKFSLCPMIECDGCGEWVHCECEDLSEKEYEALGRNKRRKFYCFKCREDERSVLFEEPNFESKDGQDGSLLLTLRNPSNPWQRRHFFLSFSCGQFVLHSQPDELRAGSLTELITNLKALFSPGKFINWQRAVKLECIFDPLRLIRLVSPGALKSEIIKLLPSSCARTDGFKPRAPFPLTTRLEIPANVKRASLQSLHLAQSINVRSCTNKTGKVPPKLLYMQYLNTVRLDESFKYVDAFSLGLALRPSRIAGLGLFAAKNFPAGSLIIEYCGEMLNSERIVNRRDAYYCALGARFRKSCYLFRLDDERVLDATLKGNLSRFINHSCDPNCYSRVVSFDAKGKKLLIFALKDIEAGEEIVYDYKFPEEEGEEKIVCYCGAPKCRGYLN